MLLGEALLLQLLQVDFKVNAALCKILSFHTVITLWCLLMNPCQKTISTRRVKEHQQCVLITIYQPWVQNKHVNNNGPDRSYGRNFKYKGYKRNPVRLFIDLHKAFDTINHSVLLKKCDSSGIRGITWNWIKSYFRL